MYDQINLNKLQTGIDGFDHISFNGLPQGRTALISGSAGSGKTIFATQFLFEGIRKSGQNGVFVTFEETPEDIIKNVSSFGWDIQKYINSGNWAFVDGSPIIGQEVIESGTYDMGALIARIESAINKVKAKRVSMDSLGAIFSQFTDSATVRRELLKISTALKKMGVTAIMTSERVDEYGDIARFGIEEFVADNVLILRNALEHEKRRRTIEILKFRGTTHQKGEFPFTITPSDGIVVIPLSSIELKQKSSKIRISSGIEELDNMTGGGFFRDSIILISGATGTGKTLTVTQFMDGGFKKGEKCLLFAFEESEEQLLRNADGWGIEFNKMVQDGDLKIVCTYPEVMGLEDHLIYLKKVINEFKPNRVAVDSLSALERVSTTKSFREFVISLTAFIKHKEIAGMFTSTTPTLLGGASVTEAHISTVTDSIILLRYVELFGEMRRGITVLKMRGSMHEKNIREYVIDKGGMHIRKPFKNITGILSGNPMHVQKGEIDRISEMFKDNTGS